MNQNISPYTLVLTLFAILIAGCTTSSAPVSMGQGIYLITRTQKGFVGSSAPVKAAAIIQANKYCERQGKVMKLIKTVQKDMKPLRSDAYAEVYFKALDPNDPELKQPTAIEEIRE